MTTGPPAEHVEPVPVDRMSALPLWAQVHADLQRRLEAGAFVAASPGEMALVSEYGVSRHSVRQALRRMREDGQLVAERGGPPRLADRPAVLLDVREPAEWAAGHSPSAQHLPVIGAHGRSGTIA